MDWSYVFTVVNTTAMVLGYMVLALLVSFVCWVIGVWHDKWKYERRRKRRHDIEWDNLRSAWLRNMDFERVDTAEQQVVDFHDRLDTAVMEFPVLEELTHEQVYDYMEDSQRDVS
jgi:hypothetical protein